MEASSRHDTALTDMVTAVAGLTCGDPVELIDQLTELERLKNAAAAAQARLTVELRQVREAEARATGRNVKRVAASVAGEVGLARHESPHRASSLVGLAGVLATEMPHTMKAFIAGDVSEWRVTILARETACLSRADRAHVDAELGPRLRELSTRQVAAEARKLAYQLDPHSVVERIGKAEADRNVTIRPAPDCMTRVSALLPAADGVAAYAALTSAADTARATGDQRSRNQIMADALIARITGQEEAGQVDVEIQLVITDEALLGDSDTPARLNDYGPIPARIARRLAADAINTERAWIRRFYVRPADGQLVAMESTRRHFPKAMKTFIKTRDDHCRTPWCDAPIRHTDHITPVHAGGPTSLANGQGICEQCNQLKEHPGWRHIASPDGTITIRTPTPQPTTRPTPRVAAHPIPGRFQIRQACGLRVD
ncbi:DUF222 domain-containing protein [Micropruina sp.]|uniref:HNH endonuclease n=1 Tax=Micropruina sp. TaxID=2737536 RepID=UPI0039E43BF1